MLQDGSLFGFSPSPITFANGISETFALMQVLKSANREQKTFRVLPAFASKLSKCYILKKKNLCHCLSFCRYHQENSLTYWPVYINTRTCSQVFRSKSKSNYISKHLVQAHLAQQNAKYNLCVAFPAEGKGAWFI